MTLTKVERLTLALQCRILAKLDTEEGHAYANDAYILEQGFTSEYINVFGRLDDEISPAQCKYVLDVIQMYSDLNHGYNRLADKTGIDAARLRFRGFDGNNENAELAFADYFINKKGRFTEFAGIDLNSHMGTGERYGRMLAEYNPRMDAARAGLTTLTNADIQAILAA